jgi:hypothetical protein
MSDTMAQPHDCLGKVSLSGSQLLAAFAAYAQFKNDNPSSDFEHYTLSVNVKNDSIEVAFMPNQPAFENANATDVVLIRVGGRTIYGRGATYEVDKSTYSILRRYWAR